jgi:glycosyltransferase involved in cell wall biosynthesis
MAKRIVISVISDLVTDQRVHKVAQTLHENGYRILLLGAKRRKSLPLGERQYAAKRMTLFFQKGFLLYAEWNIRLFFRLLFTQGDIYLANDLDTLLPNFLVSKIKRRLLVYDTHEYFTGMEELAHRPFVRKVWTKLENLLLPRVKHIYTVNRSVADLYNKQFHKQLGVVRNLPLLQQAHEAVPEIPLPFGAHQKILLMQGAGIHPNRGGEELLSSLERLPAHFVAVFAGAGLALDAIKNTAAAKSLSGRVHFTGMLTPAQLRTVTRRAFLGFSLDKPTSINHQCSLPNKLFDYLAAGVPVVTSRLPEIENIVTQYRVGMLLPEVTPGAIATAVLAMENDASDYNTCKANTQQAMKELNWEQEQERLLEIFVGVGM